MARNLEFEENRIVNAGVLKTYHNRLMSKAKYIHEVAISASGATGAFDVYVRFYRDDATVITLDELVNTYTMSNKLSNINGYISNANGTTAVFNIYFAGTTTACFNNASEVCEGSTITVIDTVVGRVI